MDGKVVGTLNVAASHKTRIKPFGEFGMSVLREHWNQGIGSALLECMPQWAKETKTIRKVNLRVSVLYEAGIHLYQKMGFQIEGRPPGISGSMERFRIVMSWESLLTVSLNLLPAS